MWSGYFNLGGNEIGNSARALGYARTAECPVHWLKDVQCAGLQGALGDTEYIHANVSDAPWYDPDTPELSARFLGLYIVSMEGIANSTRTATITEKVLDGGQVGNPRHATRQVRVRAVLTAIGEDALAAGMTWLSAALEANACGTHGSVCGESDFQFFVTCPPEGALPEEVDDLRRFLHSVTCISGPLIEQKMHSANKQVVGYVVEFTLAAAVPWVYGVTKEIEIPPTLPVVVQDTSFNLVWTPSAELAGSAVVASRNLCTNPSFEANTTGWNAVTAILTGADPTPYLTTGRVNELAAHGTWSHRHRILGNGSTAVTNARTRFDAYHDILLTTGQTPPLVPGASRVSVTAWAALLNPAGASGTVLENMEIVMEWRNGVGGSVVSSVTQQTTTPSHFNGHVFSLASQLMPAGSTAIRFHVRATVTWSSSSTPANNSDIRFYVDAIAITNP